MELSAAERHRLKKMAYGHKTEHRLRVRAQVILHASRGHSNARIARETHVHVDTVRAWRGRFAAGGLPALADRKRSGRPARFTPMQVAEAKALACQLPAETGVPLSRWSCPDLAAALTARGITDTVSGSTVRRWLHQDALKPWQYRSWIFIRAPDFRARAQRVLDLYARVFDGVPLGRDEYVVSSDEKTSIQARCRCHPTLAPGQTRAMRVKHTYGRGGALAYLAAYDVDHARVFGRCEPKTGVVPFMAPGAGHEPRALRKREARLLDRRQRLLASRQESCGPLGRQVPECRHGPHPGPRLLAEPDRATRGRLRRVGIMMRSVARRRGRSRAVGGR
ncbi:IS630 family transposase [Streptomyces umbrinus]|uniref:IS630 family transposase n=1 Tax=Streptomyces umbrinus TaxID=67370 RepID=UPI0027D869AE|nr:IS630 family transposase [Streptomyces umbrinus]